LKLERAEQDCEPQSNFVTALNTVLVWAGARTASLPGWNYCDETCIVEIIELLNGVSRQIPCHLGPVSDVVILKRPQLYRSGDGIEQGLITRLKNPRVRFTLEPPVGDEEIGCELDMYPPNTANFAATSDWSSHSAFSIWEVGSEALLYAEAWSESFLTPSQKQAFLSHCEKRVDLWNWTMKELGLPYRFYGTMDWKRSEVPLHQAVETKRLFYGKEYLGAEYRGQEYTMGTFCSYRASQTLPSRTLERSISNRRVRVA